MKSKYFEPKIEILCFDCADIVATSGDPVAFAGFTLKPLNAPSGSTPTEASGELDAF